MQTAFNQSELLRYQRHFPVIGMEGQLALRKSRVLCVGGGGLGCPALQYLAAAGVGTLGVMDGDVIEMSNLQRQILFNEQDIGRPKVEVISDRLIAQNPNVCVKVYPDFLSAANARQILADYDVVLDATDNYESRYLLNAVCRESKKPLISASIYQFDAQISVFNYQDGPCYQCLYPEPPPASLTPNCAIGGVLGVLPGVAGTLQATEAIKIILQMDGVLSGVLLSFDLQEMRFNQYEVIKQNCTSHVAINFNKETVAAVQQDIRVINAIELARRLAEEGSLQLVDVREPHERAICHIGGIHIPLPEFESQVDQLKKELPTVVYCKTGGRSATACRMLQNAGFKDVCNLDKGIMGWIETVDQHLMRY